MAKIEIFHRFFEFFSDMNEFDGRVQMIRLLFLFLVMTIVSYHLSDYLK